MLVVLASPGEGRLATTSRITSGGSAGVSPASSPRSVAAAAPETTSMSQRSDVTPSVPSVHTRNVWVPWQIDAAPEPPEGFINDIVVEVLQPCCSPENQPTLKEWLTMSVKDGGFQLTNKNPNYAAAMKWCDRHPGIRGPIDLAHDTTWFNNVLRPFELRRFHKSLDRYRCRIVRKTFPVPGVQCNKCTARFFRPMYLRRSRCSICHAKADQNDISYACTDDEHTRSD